MKVQRVIRAQGEWAKAGVDFKDKDIITILDVGQMIAGDFGDRYVFKVKTTTGEKNLSFNQTSMNHLIDDFGDDTDKWKGQDVKVWLITQSVSGQMKRVCYLTPKDWDMTEDTNGNLGFSKIKGATKLNVKSAKVMDDNEPPIIDEDPI